MSQNSVSHKTDVIAGSLRALTVISGPQNGSHLSRKLPVHTKHSLEGQVLHLSKIVSILIIINIDPLIFLLRIK